MGSTHNTHDKTSGDRRRDPSSSTESSSTESSSTESGAGGAVRAGPAPSASAFLAHDRPLEPLHPSSSVSNGTQVMDSGGRSDGGVWKQGGVGGGYTLDSHTDDLSNSSYVSSFSSMGPDGAEAFDAAGVEGEKVDVLRESV